MRRGPSGRVPHDGFIQDERRPDDAMARLLREERDREQARLRRRREDEEAIRAYLEDDRR